MKRITFICLIFLSFTTLAEAHGHHRHRARYHHRNTDGRPSAWCGWWMRQRHGVSDPSYNVARQWVHYGSPTMPHPGAIVVWPHHVGELVEQVRGDIWVVLSGNDGHAVRQRPRSIAKAIAFRS